MLKRWLFLGCVILVAVAGWQHPLPLTGERVEVALGVCLGVLAGMPIAMLVVARTPRRGGKVGTR